MKNVILTTVVLLCACSIGVQADDPEAERRALAALRDFDPIVTLDKAKPGNPVVGIRFHSNIEKKVRDDDLAHLKNMPGLRSLDAGSQEITDAGLEHLKGLKLEELDLRFNKGITVAGVVRLAKGLTTLKRLGLSGIPIQDDDLKNLRGLSGLQRLNLRATLITDKGAEHLQAFTELRDLSLMSTHVGDAGLAHLKTLTKLEDLDLDRTAITDVGLVHLAALRHLRRLQMARTAVTDTGLEQLQGLSNLEELSIGGTKVTEEGVNRLKRRLPKLK